MTEIRALLHIPSGVCGADTSAEIKQILKRDAVTPEIERLAEIHYTEADEALAEAETEDTPNPRSWAAREIGA
jgi:hypothetical protein